MHPNSGLNLNYFGPYQDRYQELVNVRVYIKHKEFDKVREMFDGNLKPYLKDEHDAKAVSKALKIPINAVYGMSSAKFDNKFKHPNNVDNIIAKRGSLFMIDLKYAVQEFGYEVIHIKTDSIKVANADDKVKDFIFEFGKKYGYEFEHEATYEKLALINKAEYICYDGKEWSATGKRFSEPYVFKTLFSKEPIVDDDYSVIIQSHKGHLYLGDEFIGKIGKFYPSLVGWKLTARVEGDDEVVKESSPSGTKDKLWMKWDDYTTHKNVSIEYFDNLIEEAKKSISAVGDLSQIIE